MNKNKLYNTLEIPGSFLVPGFSIYVLEIKSENRKWFYIGMTGDPHYPSARSAFHRISGHLELSPRSTQNQLMLVLKNKLEIENAEEFKKVTIKMYHYPIAGFKRITEEILNKENVVKLKTTDDYKNYKKLQQKVLALEKALIIELKEKLLNKTTVKKIKADDIPYPEIYNSIIELVKKG